MRNVPADAHSELPPCHKSVVQTDATTQAVSSDDPQSNKEHKHERIQHDESTSEDEMDEFPSDLHAMDASGKCYLRGLVLYSRECKLRVIESRNQILRNVPIQGYKSCVGEAGVL